MRQMKVWLKVGSLDITIVMAVYNGSFHFD